MRTGVNPEKFKNEKNTQYYHRVIIPVYIPNTIDSYYKKMPAVFETMLTQLIDTIDLTKTAITVIDNNSCGEVKKIIEDKSPHIDKLIQYSENKGKVYAVLTEARGCYEPFITIADADVLFVKGWEKEIFTIFRNFKKAGIVAPLPSQGLALNNNKSLFFDTFFNRQLKYGKVVSDNDCDIYLHGMGNKALLDRHNRLYNWREIQYYLHQKGTFAIVGAGHFVATYRTELFKGEISFPEIKFKNGYEDKFIDSLADKRGYYRLSTVDLKAYHIGTQLDTNVIELLEIDGPKAQSEDFAAVDWKINKNLVPYNLKSFCFKILKRIKKF
ncbi:glycosyltransferase family A protein [Aequorivita echinoideorum]|uniref:Glycosyltransferase family 2 protein n=1 Tax=Aequorivita echinoideorum TaxID=1549647 RepID=A0ABS5S5F5_9FLAO|nr:glycosyltransferase family A protein [Aequorivita echinoideorum]MBT0608451.1 glycosyltransferase family 2 protein [Aequorivita echinoideorum]